MSGALTETVSINFADYMEMALYHPKYGYYMRPNVFGPEGDFVTAPMMSPLLAEAIVNWLVQQNVDEVCEIAPGNGMLAQQIASRLPHLKRYWLLDKNPDPSQKYLENQDSRFVWTSDIPKDFNGALIANEWLDALPFRRFCLDHDQLFEFVMTKDTQTLSMKLIESQAMDALAPYIQPFCQTWPSPYVFEHCFELTNALKSLSGVQGPKLIIDYGYEAAELYHSERVLGSMLCISQHQVVPFSLAASGSFDITAAVNWSMVQDTLLKMGFTIENYGPQSDFILANIPHRPNIENNVLVNQFEMGQYVKVLSAR